MFIIFFPKRLVRTLSKTYPHLNEQQLGGVMCALRDYFHLCVESDRKKSVAMPSQAVDVVWHEFILFTRAYSDFCQKSFGHFLHHTPAEAMQGPTSAQRGIKNAWRLACEQAHINPKSPSRLPLLFAIDEEYAIPDGFRYALNCKYTVQGAGKSSGDNVFCATHIVSGATSGASCGGVFGSIFGGGDNDGGGVFDSIFGGGDNDGCGSGCGGD